MLGVTAGFLLTGRTFGLVKFNLEILNLEIDIWKITHGRCILKYTSVVIDAHCCRHYE